MGEDGKQWGRNSRVAVELNSKLFQEKQILSLSTLKAKNKKICSTTKNTTQKLACNVCHYNINNTFSTITEPLVTHTAQHVIVLGLSIDCKEVVLTIIQASDLRWRNCFNSRKELSFLTMYSLSGAVQYKLQVWSIIPRSHTSHFSQLSCWFLWASHISLTHFKPKFRLTHDNSQLC